MLAEPQGPLKTDVKVLLRGRNVTLGTESLTSRMSLGLGWGSLQKMDVTSLTVQVELSISVST